jgi:hypothetical protein
VPDRESVLAASGKKRTKLVLLKKLVAPVARIDDEWEEF